MSTFRDRGPEEEKLTNEPGPFLDGGLLGWRRTERCPELVLWLLGMVSSYTLGGFIHILLVIALAIVLIRVIQGRRPV